MQTVDSNWNYFFKYFSSDMRRIFGLLYVRQFVGALQQGIDVFTRFGLLTIWPDISFKHRFWIPDQSIIMKNVDFWTKVEHVKRTAINSGPTIAEKNVKLNKTASVVWMSMRNAYQTVHVILDVRTDVHAVTGHVVTTKRMTIISYLFWIRKTVNQSYLGGFSTWCSLVSALSQWENDWVIFSQS